MKQTMILCACLLLGSLAEAQTGGACQSAQALVCAGNFIGTISITPYPMRTDGDLCPYSAVGSGILYTAQYGGSYEDFTNMPQGLGWYDVDAGQQTLYANDSCFVPCSSSAPGITGPMFNCPNPNGASVAQANATWTGQQTAPDGNLMGEQPYFLSGGINSTFDCNTQSSSVQTGPATFITVTVYRCHADYPTASIGSYMGAPSPAHCVLTVKNSGDAPPNCTCGGPTAASCSNNTWQCPATSSQQSYTFDATCDADCTCTYSETDYYQCGNFVGSDIFPIFEQCPPV